MKEKIDAIYKGLADKTLRFGCIYKLKDGHTERIGNGVKFSGSELYINGGYEKIDKQIGNPVMIGDVLDSIEKEIGADSLYKAGSTLAMITIIGLLNLWKHKRLPIEEQSEECIDYIYNLIENDRA